MFLCIWIIKSDSQCNTFKSMGFVQLTVKSYDYLPDISYKFCCTININLRFHTKTCHCFQIIY